MLNLRVVYRVLAVSKLEFFVTLVNGFQQLPNVTKSFI